ncbi:MAG: uroporphyrinogen decarboxylase [Verrucomicrobiia bacterium]
MSEIEDKKNSRTDKASVFAQLTRRERFARAIQCLPVDYPPVWMMRQAGRALPEYRELKESYSFVELVKTPDLAAEVTLQPIRRFDFDAAIIFSDILVIPEAMGQPYHFTDGNGVKMDFAISTYEDILKLNTSEVEQRLNYVFEALRIVRKTLGNKTALIGFAGSPWTLANFMLEGGSSKSFEKARKLISSDRKSFELLMDKLTTAIIQYLDCQAKQGVDAVQIFDTLGWLLSENEFEAASGMWIRKIVEAIKVKVPVIVFCKGVHKNWDELISTGANAIGIDHNFSLAEARRILPKSVAIQGNLDPELLRLDDPQPAVEQTKLILSQMNGRNGFIFNLGHGVPQDARLRNIEEIIKIIRKD